MSTNRIKQIGQLIFTLFITLGALISVGYWLTGGETAVAAPLADMSVDIGDSSMADDGFCSLREAISNASANTQLFSSAGECPAGNGTDTITLGLDVTLTITDNNADGNDANGLPVITSTIVISGNGYTLSRDGASPPFRFFYLNQSNSILTLQNITVTNGNADTSSGGALYMTTGQAMIESATISNNQAANGGGIYLDNGVGTLSHVRLISNTATANGGGVSLSNAALHIKDNSEIAYNQAADGAGIYAYSDAHFTMADSYLHHNLADTEGGGAYLNPESVTRSAKLMPPHI